MMTSRKLKNDVMGFLVAGSAVLLITVLVVILWHIFISGAKYLSLDFFTKAPAPFGESGGGVVNAIIGTFLITLVAAAIGTPFGMHRPGLHVRADYDPCHRGSFEPGPLRPQGSSVRSWRPAVQRRLERQYQDGCGGHYVGAPHLHVTYCR
jgi:hypothetical protein